ncbi:MAG: DnaJ domain-containing protein [Pseudomonadota bacterium]
MSKLVLLLAIVLAVWLTWKQLSRGGPPDRKTLIRYALIGGGVLLVLLVLTGRAHALFGAIGAALAMGVRMLPQLVRYLPILQRVFGGLAGASGGGQGQSTVNGNNLRMTLDHDSGRMDGTMSKGPLAGRALSSLTVEELRQVWAACQGDADDLRLLHAYLQRERAGEWQPENPGAAPGGSSSGEMTEDEAYAVLGLAPGASDAEVVDAHRRLIAKMHPDKGGSDYLASRINLAKDRLRKS